MIRAARYGAAQVRGEVRAAARTPARREVHERCARSPHEPMRVSGARMFYAMLRVPSAQARARLLRAVWRRGVPRE